MGNRIWSRISTVMVLLIAVAAVGFANGAVEEVEVPPEQVGLGNAKYVFTFIGDGMGLPQIAAAEAYLANADSSEVGYELLSFSEFPAQGLTTTYASNQFITDSAAAATSLACGEKTTTGTIAMNGAGTRELPTIAEMAKEAGMRVGILSSVNVDHATPASYYAHSPSRNNYYDIGVQLANSNFDYIAGGRVRLSKTPDGEPSVLDIMQDNGWIIAGDRASFESLAGADGQVFAYNYGFAGDALDYDMDRESDDISLAEFTEMGIELLDNPNGFFMMIEGGKIDWACHANDGVAAVWDTIAFDESVRVALDFYMEHPDETLIIVTGDHECGGLTLGYAGTGYGSAFDVLDKQTASFEYFNSHVFAPYKESHTLADADSDDLLAVVEEYFGLSDLTEYEQQMIEQAFIASMGGETERATDEETYLLYGGYEPLTVTLTHIVNRRAGLAWTSYSHTGVPVPTFAIGPGSGLFNGYYDNTDVFHKTVQAIGLTTGMASR